jgi:large subunit ribosomal protein L28
MARKNLSFLELSQQLALAPPGFLIQSDWLLNRTMSRICEITGVGPIKGSHIWRSGKAKKKGGIGTHITAITKRRFLPNLQRVKALIDGEVRYIRVSARALKKGSVVKAPKRRWSKTAKATAAK